MNKETYQNSSTWQTIDSITNRIQDMNNEALNESDKDKQAECYSFFNHVRLFKKYNNTYALSDDLWNTFTDNVNTISRQIDGMQRGSSYSWDTLFQYLDQARNSFSDVAASLLITNSDIYTDFKDSIGLLLDEKIQKSNAKLSELDGKIADSEKISKRADETANTTDSKVETAKTNYNEIFDDLEKIHKDRELRLYNSFIKMYEEHLKEFENFVERQKDEIIATNKKVKDIASIVNGTTASDAFSRHSRNERLTGLGAYLLGIISLVLGAIFSINLFGHSGTLQEVIALQPNSLIFKGGLALISGVIATVCIRIGSQAMYRSNEFKRQHLEVLSLPALVREEEAGNDPDMRKEIIRSRMSYFERAYGKTWDVAHKPQSSEESLGADSYTQLLKMLIVKELKKEDTSSKDKG